MIHRALLTLVCLVPLAAFGGAYRWLTLPLLALTTLAFLVHVRDVVDAGRSQRGLNLLLVAGCFALALQLVPLPQGVIDLVSPEAARIRSAVRLVDSPESAAAWKPLSIDPEATAHALGVALSGLLAFFSAQGVFARGGVRRWCQVLAWVGLIVAIAAVAQRASTPELIYGFWPPRDPTGRPFGPFVNRNHFAGWLLMAGFLVGGYTVAHADAHMGTGPRHVRRWLRVTARAGTQLYMSAALVMMVTVTLTLSRSAMVGLAAGVLFGGLVMQRRVRASAGAQLAVAAGVVILGVMLSARFVDSESLAQRFEETMLPGSNSRLGIWRQTVPLVCDFWATGVGSGSYGSAMLMYERPGAATHVNQAHSHYLQVAAEGGVLLALPWLLAGVVFIAHASKAVAGDRSDTFFIRLGALCGVVAIAAQSLWETPLRMSANAMLFAVLCGIALHQRQRPQNAR